jgi:hypothetical protein
VRRGLLLLLALGACSGSDANPRVETCAPTTLWPVDEGRHCLGPSAAADGLESCFYPDEAQGHSATPACVINADDGGVFVALSSSTQHFESDGGWHVQQTAQGFASTLDETDQLRCGVMSPQGRAQGTCGTDGG